MKANEGGEILRQHIRELGEHSLIEGLSASARFERFDGRTKSMVEVFAPMWLARTLQQRGSNLRLPILSGVIYAPTLRKDGTLLCEPGYDEKTGLVFDPQGIEFQPISNNPSKEQGLAELDRLKALLSTFCFETPADRSVALSAILTAVVRKSAIKQAPMHCFDAPTAGSGKSKLVDITCVIATGREAGITGQGRSEEELEKRLSGLLFAGEQIAIDNCTMPLGGSFLCSLLTQSMINVRILGKSDMIAVTTNVFTTATGNNLPIAGDMTRRVLISRLDPGTERPELRKFDNDPVADAKARRPQLIARLTLPLGALGKPIH